jgi:hypothetical protein
MAEDSTKTIRIVVDTRGAMAAGLAHEIAA